MAKKIKHMWHMGDNTSHNVSINNHEITKIVRNDRSATNNLLYYKGKVNFVNHADHIYISRTSKINENHTLSDYKLYFDVRKIHNMCSDRCDEKRSLTEANITQ